MLGSLSTTANRNVVKYNVSEINTSAYSTTACSANEQQVKRDTQVQLAHVRASLFLGVRVEATEHQHAANDERRNNATHGLRAAFDQALNQCNGISRRHGRKKGYSGRR
eukprot:gb/GEZJ01000117.1/.p1 GENE.gb/GEZJ01000117.1/~~gb/GEZJ01000117.1/.p1  ORF type:complete len:109 (+),score=7.37 gb/GEZJ01000117.1/:354-680(+)